MLVAAAVLAAESPEGLSNIVSVAKECAVCHCGRWLATRLLRSQWLCRSKLTSVSAPATHKLRNATQRNGVRVTHKLLTQTSTQLHDRTCCLERATSGASLLLREIRLLSG